MAALASPSKGQTRYGKAPSIKSKPAMKESAGDEERSATPKEHGTSNSPRPESGTGGAQPHGSVTSGTDGVEVHSDKMAAMHERHHKELKEMHDRHRTEHEHMHERHHDDHKKMHKRHEDEHKAMMSEGEAEAATAAGSMGVTAGQ
jgi:hypothetical protein